MENETRVSLVERFFRWVERIARAVVGFFLKLVHVELTEKQWTAFLQFVRYGVVGAANTVVNLLFSFLALWLIGKTGWDGVILGVPGFDRHLGTLTGFLACCVNSYWFNSRYTFAVREKRSFKQHASAFLKVVLSYSFAMLLLGWTLNFLWLALEIDPRIGFIINAAVGVPINFLLNKFWAFK